MDTLIVMFALPDVWIEAADKRVVCEFPSAWPGDEGRDFEDRKQLAYQVKDALMVKAPITLEEAVIGGAMLALKRSEDWKASPEYQDALKRFRRAVAD